MLMHKAIRCLVSIAAAVTVTSCVDDASSPPDAALDRPDTDAQPSCPGENSCAWTVVSDDSITGYLGAIAFTGNDVWVGGVGASGQPVMSFAAQIYHLSGSTWNRSFTEPVGPSDALFKAWSIGSDVYVTRGGLANQMNGSLLHWHDGAWTEEESGTTLVGIWGIGPSDMWAVGSRIIHWNGQSWTSVVDAVPNMGVQFGVWGSAPDDVWGVGIGQPAIYHWNGSAWTAISAVSAALFDVWGVGASNVWAVGTTPSNNSQGIVLHWDGSQWNTVWTGSAGKGLQGVWAAAPNDVWAVADQGGILHWDGTNWNWVPNLPTRSYAGVRGRSAGDVWAVGNSGTVLHYGPTPINADAGSL